MLTNRLVGTTEASVSYRGGHHHSDCQTAPALWLATGERVAQSSLVTASPKGLWGADAKIADYPATAKGASDTE